MSTPLENGLRYQRNEALRIAAGFASLATALMADVGAAEKAEAEKHGKVFDDMGQSIPMCPACGQLLDLMLDYREEGGDREWKFFLYCQHGPCHCQASNDGAGGDTIPEALEKLRKKIEHEN